MTEAHGDGSFPLDGGGSTSSGPRRPDAFPGDIRYRRIVESAVDYAIIATDRTGRITEWNEAAETIFGWPATDILGEPLATLFTPEDVAAGVPEAEMRQSLGTGKARDDRWLRRADGSRFYANGELAPLTDEGETPIGFIKILRDRTAEEIARRELKASREHLALALEASAIVGTWDWDVEKDVVRADARFAAFYGLEPEIAARGLPLDAYARGIHAGDRSRVEAAIRGAIEGADDYSAEYRTVDTAGRIRVVRARGRCFREGGRVVRFPGAIVEVTAERRREARQRALLALGDDLLTFGAGADYTARALEVLGTTLDLVRAGYMTLDAGERTGIVSGEWTASGVPALPRAVAMERFGPAFLDALRQGTLIVSDVAADPATRTGLSAFQAYGIAAALHLAVVEDGHVRVILYLHDARQRIWEEEDVAFVREILSRAWTLSRRRDAEQALIDAETRLRLAQAAADIGTFDLDVETGTLNWDARCRAAFGIFDDRPVDYAQTFRTAIHPDDGPAVDAAVAATLDPAENARYDIVYRVIGREDGVLRHIHATGQALVEGGRTRRFVGAVRDVTREKESEERQTLLTRELQHRVKNTLAMVNALANQTLRRAANTQEGLAAFSARLIALSHAHDILTQTSWTSAPIGAIIEEALASHQGEGSPRIRWSGPDVRLTAKQSLALALALHELATNAVKYGALSGEAGRVDIAWRIDHGQGHPRLAFEWRESGGPRVAPPQSRGFGSRLIEQSLALEFGGTVELTYPEDGALCRIDAPMQDGGSGEEG